MNGRPEPDRATTIARAEQMAQAAPSAGGAPAAPATPVAQATPTAQATPPGPGVVVAGSATRDVDPSDPRGWRLGGTAPYVALGIARLGFRVGLLLGADHQAAGARELDLLHEAGITLAVVPFAEGPVFHNRETPDGRHQLCLSVGEELAPRALPTAWEAAATLVLAPVAGELGVAWADALPDASLVALALQGTLRVLSPGRPTALRPPRRDALSMRADLLMVGRDDIARAAVGDPLESLLARSGQRMVVTAGTSGALHLRRGADGRLAVRRLGIVPSGEVVDLTGAGDAFFAGWIAATLASRDTADWRALLIAAAAASLKVEGYGLGGLPTAAAVRRRLREAGLTRG